MADPEEGSKIFFYRDVEEGKIPKRASASSAGFDLASAYKYSVRGHTSVSVDTGIKVIFPPGCYGRIAGRSGLALKYKLIVGGGVIDSDYTGTLKIILINLSSKTFKVHIGDRVGQLICEKYFTGEQEEVGSFQKETERQSSGMGSTGIAADEIQM